ncbi:response regulator transcription factor [Planctomycetota bacterium]
MANKVKQHIFFVDDEPHVRKVVGKTLERLGKKVSCFASARDCLEKLSSERCDLLITDVKMPGMDGLELLTEAKRIAPWLTVMVVTAYGDIQMAVKSLNMGALDFIVKPLGMQRLLCAVESALKQTTPPNSLHGKEFSRTERRILHFILDGKSNKETAYILHRSVKTVKAHRYRIMLKLGVSNVMDLVKRATEMGLVDL